MRDPKRIPEILNELKSVWSSFPDLRLGQLIGNVMTDSMDFYYMEDDDLIKVIRDHYSEVTNIEDHKPNV